MYKIVGSDGREYGPIPAEVVRSWVQQGRANGQTRVLPDGSADWIALAACAEFADLFPVIPDSVAGAPGSLRAVPATTSGMAVTSLVMSILSVASCGITLVVTTPLGLILGIVSLGKIKRSQGRLRGRGVALAGIIISCVSLVFIPIFAAMVLPAIARVRNAQQTIRQGQAGGFNRSSVSGECVNNLKVAGLSIRLYALDHEDKFPKPAVWCDAITNEMGTLKAYACPARPSLKCGYAFNSKLAGKEHSKVDSATVMIFESDSGWNASGGKELMIQKPRHGGKFTVCFADGSVEEVAADEAATLRWDPTPATRE